MNSLKKKAFFSLFIESPLSMSSNVGGDGTKLFLDNFNTEAHHLPEKYIWFRQRKEGELHKIFFYVFNALQEPPSELVGSNPWQLCSFVRCIFRWKRTFDYINDKKKTGKTHFVSALQKYLNEQPCSNLSQLRLWRSLLNFSIRPQWNIFFVSYVLSKIIRIDD